MSVVLPVSQAIPISTDNSSLISEVDSTKAIHISTDNSSLVSEVDSTKAIHISTDNSSLVSEVDSTKAIHISTDNSSLISEVDSTKAIHISTHISTDNSSLVSEVNIPKVSSRENYGYENMPRFHFIATEAALLEKPSDLSETEYIIWLENLANHSNFFDLSKKAAAKGYLEFLKRVHESGRKMDIHLLFIFAARKGHRKIMDWVEETFGELDDSENTCSDACGLAAENGQIEIVKYLLERGFYIPRLNFNGILSHGHVEVVKFMMKREEFCYHLLDYFERHEYLIKDTALPLIKYYLDEYVTKKKREIQQEWIDWAARCEQIEALKLLAEYGIYPSTDCFEILFKRSQREKYWNGKLGEWYRDNKIAEKDLNKDHISVMYID
jgi:hypothetical protein